MPNSSFYGDGLPYEEGDLGVGNVPSPTVGIPENANSSFYPDGTGYEALASSDTVLAEMVALEAAATADAAASAASAVSSAASALSSSNSATTATAQAVIATTQAGNASASASAALLSELAAAASAAAALLSETNADTSEAAALVSELAAAAQAVIATTQASNASTSAANALTSEGNADTSEANALASASAAATSATNAATSATNAAAAVQAAAGTASPLMDGSVAVGTGVKWAREDHRHPTDTTLAPLASPALTGTPTAPTQSAGNNTTRIATTAFVEAARVILAAATALKSNTASPTFTGTPAAPTATAGTNTTQLATTAFVEAARVILAAADALKAPLASPTLTGTPLAPTASPGTNTTQLATTAFVEAARVILAAATALKADLASPTFTGVPAAPTAGVGTNTTQLATTAFVLANGGSGGSTKPNHILNSAMMVSQQNGSTAGTTTGYYPVDQFSIIFTNGGAVSVAQVASATPGGSPNRIRVTATTADASVGASDTLFIQQSIEGVDVADLRFGSASAKSFILQFGVKAPAGTYGVFFRNGVPDRTWIGTYVISGGEANTDVVKSVTLTADTTGTWGVGTGIGLTVGWTLMAGSSSQAGAGWQGASGVLSTSGQFNFMGTLSNVFELFDVGLYEGSVAPAFQVPQFASEQVKCQRFWEKSYDYATAVGTATYSSAEGAVLGMAAATINLSGVIARFKASKRSTPTIVHYSPATGASGKVRDNGNSVDVTPASTDYIGENGFRVYITMTANTATALTSHWTANARL